MKNYFLAIFVFVFSFGALAQAQGLILDSDINRPWSTNYLNVGDQNHVPLYNCEIYNYDKDFELCKLLRNSAFMNLEWNNNGYAVNCDNFGDLQNQCRKLARYVANDKRTINCRRNSLQVGVEYQRCLQVQTGYMRGYFDQSKRDIGGCIDCDTRDEVVIVEPVIVDSPSSYRQCYVNGRDAWVARKQKIDEANKKKDDGALKIILGLVGTGVGQAIKNNSKDSGGRMVGDVVTALSLGLAAYGLIEMATADLPNNDVSCRQYYQAEPARRVVVQKQECYTTRYYSRSWQNEGVREVEYFETKCSNQTYVSYERNSAFY